MEAWKFHHKHRQNLLTVPLKFMSLFPFLSMLPATTVTLAFTGCPQAFLNSRLSQSLSLPSSASPFYCYKEIPIFSTAFALTPHTVTIATLFWNVLSLSLPLPRSLDVNSPHRLCHNIEHFFMCCSILSLIVTCVLGCYPCANEDGVLHSVLHVAVSQLRLIKE